MGAGGGFSEYRRKALDVARGALAFSLATLAGSVAGLGPAAAIG